MLFQATVSVTQFPFSHSNRKLTRYFWRSTDNHTGEAERRKRGKGEKEGGKVGECDPKAKKRDHLNSETHIKREKIYASISDGFSVSDSSFS